jgi:uncharacterized delta-60 repeat protein
VDDGAAQVRKAALFLFSFVLLLAGGAEGLRGQSALDGFDPNPNGAVRVIVVQPDGKILIGGDFTTLAPNGGATVSRNYIARLNPDGTLDAAFNPSADGSVLSFAVLADGKVVAGGDFTNIGGQPRRHLARLDGTTGLADSFDPGPNGRVRTIAVQADGKILAGGDFGMVAGVERIGIARFDGTTGLLDSFDPQGRDVYSIVLQADGKILVAGHFILIGGQMRRGIARLDPATGQADSFDPSIQSGGFSQDDIFAIAVQADGKILLGGTFVAVGGGGNNWIARVDPVTGHADSFNPNANEIVYSIVVQPDGKILAAGNFTNIGGQPRNYIARLDPVTGQADSFDPHASLNLATIAVQADGKVLAGGYFSTLAPNGGAAVTRNRIARLEADGRLDRTLDVNMFPIGVLATAVQPDGKVLIGGGFTSVSGVERNHIARLNRDGTLDIAFDPNATGIVGADIVYSLAVQWDGKVLVGGTFTSVSGQPRNRMARLDATTGLPDSFDPDINGAVNAIALQADGMILAGGDFSTVGGQTRMGLARIDPTTGLADSFNANADGSVASIVVQADGKIVTGGNFSSMGGQTRNRIARLDATTGLADSFNPDANDQVFSVTVQPDGKILAGGSFTSIGGQIRSRIARLDGTTGLADSFDPSANAFANVFSIAVQADGKVIAGGEFTGIGGQPRNGIARLDATTGLADSFDPQASGSVSSIAVQGDGKILAGGGFNSISGQPRSGLARLTNDTSALQDLAVTEKTVTWTRSGSSPQFTRVSFAYSNDNANYVLLGNGTAAGSTWTVGGLSLPTGQNFYIRARGYSRSGRYNGSESITDSVRTAFLPPPTKAINVSTRMLVQTGENVGIGGFIITGSIPKRVLIRGIGPSLFFSGVPNWLNDPTLELFNSDHSIAYNNDWQDTDGSAIRATGLSPIFDLEAALLVTLPAGSYTAVLRGNNEGTGVALVEVYDLNLGIDSKLANLSTRAFVSTNDDIVIAGCTLGGDGDDRIVVRGIGPSLAAFGVTNALANPTLELRNSDGALLSSNNDWQDDAAQAAELTAAGLAPSSNLEAAIAVTLPPGPYTALLAGRNNGTGVGVVEIYDRGAP